MKGLIKWLYYRYVYPDEVEEMYKILDNQPLFIYRNAGEQEMAIIERARTPDDELH